MAARATGYGNQYSSVSQPPSDEEILTKSTGVLKLEK